MPSEKDPRNCSSLYESLGASASKAGLHSALEMAGIKTQSEHFCPLEKDIAGDEDFASFMHCDGCGTKGIVAYLLFRETGNPEAFAALAQDALAMNLDDIFCLGIPQSLQLANIINRNARLIPDQALSAIIARYHSLAAMLEEHDIPLTVSGGETADCGDIVKTLSVDAILSGRIRRDSVVNLNTIVPGDIIVGLQSDGQTSYENSHNSGIGSNGLTLARHALLSGSYAVKYPETSSSSPRTSGGFMLTDSPAGLGMNIGQALSSPTRTYAPILKEIFSKLKGQIHGAIHVTGGGLTKVLRFGRGNHYVKDNLFPTPPLFELIQEHGAVDWKEMYQVFNMGQRLELYVPERCLKMICDLTESFGISARRIGKVEKSSGEKNKVSVESEHGVFSYQLSGH